MTCVGKKSSEIKDDLVLITMFAGTQANTYTFLTKQIITMWTFCIYTHY